MDDDAAGPASPPPAEVPVDLRRLVDRCPRIRGFAYIGRDRAEVLMGDGDGRAPWWLGLPARIRGQWVTNMTELVEAEIAAPIQPGDVAQ